MSQVAGTMAVQGGLRMAYQAPRIEVTDYAGPAGPCARSTSAAAGRHLPLRAGALRRGEREIGRRSRPSRLKLTPVARPRPRRAGDYTYSGIALRDIKDGKIASTHGRARDLHRRDDAAGKTETLTGDVANLAAYDFDAAATLVHARSGARE